MNSKTMTYQFVSNYAVIIFDAQGKEDWSEEMFDSVGEATLAGYVLHPQDFHLDDTWVAGEDH